MMVQNPGEGVKKMSPNFVARRFPQQDGEHGFSSCRITSGNSKPTDVGLWVTATSATFFFLHFFFPDSNKISINNATLYLFVINTPSLFFSSRVLGHGKTSPHHKCSLTFSLGNYAQLLTH